MFNAVVLPAPDCPRHPSWPRPASQLRVPDRCSSETHSAVRQAAAPLHESLIVCAGQSPLKAAGRCVPAFTRAYARLPSYSARSCRHAVHCSQSPSPPSPAGGPRRVTQPRRGCVCDSRSISDVCHHRRHHQLDARDDHVHRNGSVRRDARCQFRSWPASPATSRKRSIFLGWRPRDSLQAAVRWVTPWVFNYILVSTAIRSWHWWWCSCASPPATRVAVIAVITVWLAILFAAHPRHQRAFTQAKGIKTMFDVQAPIGITAGD